MKYRTGFMSNSSATTYTITVQASPEVFWTHMTEEKGTSSYFSRRLVALEHRAAVSHLHREISRLERAPYSVFSPKDIPPDRELKEMCELEIGRLRDEIVSVQEEHLGTA